MIRWEIVFCRFIKLYRRRELNAVVGDRVVESMPAPASKDKAKMGRRRWYIFLVFGIQFMLAHLHRMSPAVLASDLVNAFHVSATGLGFLSSAYYYAYCFAQIPVGILSDKIGVRKTAVLFGVIGVAGSTLFALATSFPVAILSRILIGLGVAAIFVPGMKALGELFRGNEYARISGLFMSAGAVGWLLSALPLAAFTLIFTWRTFFLLLSLVMLVLVALTWLAMASAPQKKQAAPPVEKTDNKKEKTGSQIRIMLLERHFWSTALWFFTRSGISFGFFGLWVGPYLMDVYGLSKLHASQILCMYPLGIIVGSPLLGYLSDKVLMSRKKITLGTSVFHSIFWVVMVVFFADLSLPVLSALFFFMGIIVGSPGTVSLTSIKEQMSAGIAGTSIGAVNMAGFLGTFLMQPLIGYIIDISGNNTRGSAASAYRSVFWVFLGVSCVALISIAFSKETLTKDADHNLFPRDA